MASRNSASGVLFKVLGRRPSIIFGLVTGLVVFLLAAVTVTSRYAMQRYVADQVERVPWDLSIYQTAEVPLADKLWAAIARCRASRDASASYFLRTIPPYTLRPIIDGQPLRSPWISMLTRDEPSLIPPDIRPTGDGAVLVLVGSKIADGRRLSAPAEPQEVRAGRGQAQEEDDGGTSKNQDPRPQRTSSRSRPRSSA